MDKIQDYILCSRATKLEFNQEIRYLLDEGFQPFGEPFSLPDIQLSLYCQAMVRYNHE